MNEQAYNMMIQIGLLRKAIKYQIKTNEEKRLNQVYDIVDRQNIIIDYEDNDSWNYYVRINKSLATKEELSKLDTCDLPCPIQEKMKLSNDRQKFIVDKGKFWEYGYSDYQTEAI